MPRKPLYPKTEEVWRFIDRHVKEFGFAPTVREIAKTCSHASTSTVAFHIKRLEDLGYVQRFEGKARGIKLLKHPPKADATAQEGSP